jgi:hypothetical protein
MALQTHKNSKKYILLTWVCNHFKFRSSATRLENFCTDTNSETLRRKRNHFRKKQHKMSKLNVGFNYMRGGRNVATKMFNGLVEVVVRMYSV